MHRTQMTEGSDGFQPRRQQDGWRQQDILAPGSSGDHSMAVSSTSHRRWSRTVNSIEAVGQFKRRISSVKPTPTSHTSQGGSNAGGKNAGKAAHSSANANTSFAKTMDMSAKKITAAVHSLYKGAREGDAVSLHDAPRRPSTLGPVDGTDGNRMGLVSEEDGRRSGSPDSSDTDSTSSKKKSKQAPDPDEDEEYQSDDEYDFKHAALKVTSLLDSLNCDARLDIMSSLNSFYVARRARVDEDLKDLGNDEEEFLEREEQTKNSMQSMLTTFEDKQMREVKVLVKCNKTLHLGASGRLKQRRRFAKQSSMQSATSKYSKVSVKSPRGLSPSSRARRSESDGSTPKAGMDGVSEEGDGRRDSKDEEEDSNEDEDDSDKELGENDEEDEEESKRAKAAEEQAAEEKKKIDGLDVEAAKRKLKEMHEVPSRVLMLVNLDAPPAADILQALAQVQEGQVQLEHQAELAKKALEISKAAVEHLIEGKENPNNAVLELIEEIRFGIFGENGEELTTGPDPEELEEECKMLEALIAKQEKEIDVLNKQRERTNRLEQEVSEVFDDGKSDGSAEEQAPQLLKSELRDGRIEAAQSSKLSNTASGRLQREITKEVDKMHNSEVPASESAGQAALGRVKTAMKMDKIVSRMATSDLPNESDNPPEQAGATIGTVPSWQSNRQIQMLQSKIQEQEGKISKAREVHKRMKKEYAMLKYCAKMSDAGLEAILESFNPDDAGGDSESDWESSDEEKKKDKQSVKEIKVEKADNEQAVSSDASDKVTGSPKKDGTKKRRASLGNATETSGSEQDSPKSPKQPKSIKKSHTLIPSDEQGKRGSPKRSATVPLSQQPPKQPAPQSPEQQGETVVRSKRGRMDMVDFQGQVNEFNRNKLEQAEAEMQTRIKDLQAEIANDARLIKGEKKKQTSLKKELKKLKKNFANMARQNKGIPTSLEALDQQMIAFTEGETKIQEQIEELRLELAKQQRLLEKAQNEARESEERRRQSQVASEQPRMSQSQSQLIPDPRLSLNLTAVSEQNSQKRQSSLPGVDKQNASPTPVFTLSTPTPAVIPASHRASNASATSRLSTMGNVVENSSEGPPVDKVRGSVATQRQSTLEPVNSTLPNTRINPEGTASDSDQDRPRPSQLQVNRPSTLAPLGTPGVTPVGSRPSTLNKIPVVGAPSPVPPAPAVSAVSHEDLNELVKLQSRNEELKNEIDEMMKKMKQLRNAMKIGRGAGLDAEFIRQIVGGAKEQVDNKPPPEYSALKKELRMKQNEVRTLRKRWWEDHKDLDILAEKVKQNLQYDVQALAQVPRSMEPLQPEKAERASIEKSELIAQMTSELRRNTNADLPNLRRTNISELRRGSAEANQGQDRRTSNSQSNSQSNFSFEELGRSSVGVKTDVNPKQFQRAATGHGLEALMAAPTMSVQSHAKEAARTRAATWTTKAEEEEVGHTRRSSDVFARYQGVRKSLGLPHHTLKELLGEDVDVHDRSQPVFKRSDTDESFDFRPDFKKPSIIKRADTSDGFSRR